MTFNKYRYWDAKQLRTFDLKYVTGEMPVFDFGNIRLTIKIEVKFLLTFINKHIKRKYAECQAIGILIPVRNRYDI
jgi:hypothetical protein